MNLYTLHQVERKEYPLGPIPVATCLLGLWVRILRLHKIRIAPDDKCCLCGDTDTLRHRLIVCGVGHLQWELTKGRIAAMRRIDPRWIEEDCLLRPQFHLRPPSRHSGTMDTGDIRGVPFGPRKEIPERTQGLH